MLPFALGLEGHGGPKDFQAFPDGESSSRDTKQTQGSPVSDTFINVTKKGCSGDPSEGTLHSSCSGKNIHFQFILSMYFASFLVLVNDLRQKNDFILLPLCTVTKDEEHRGMVAKATSL